MNIGHTNTVFASQALVAKTLRRDAHGRQRIRARGRHDVEIHRIAVAGFTIQLYRRLFAGVDFGKAIAAVVSGPYDQVAQAGKERSLAVGGCLHRFEDVKFSVIVKSELHACALDGASLLVDDSNVCCSRRCVIFRHVNGRPIRMAL